MTNTAPKTMQEALDQAIASHVEGVLFFIKDGMSKERAIAFERESSCMGDKIWNQISEAVDARQATS